MSSWNQVITGWPRQVASGLVGILVVPAVRIGLWASSLVLRNKTVNEEFPAKAGAVEGVVEVSTGTFRDGDRVYKGSGQATIYSLPGGGHLLRLEDFSSTRGPEVDVFLSAHPDPKSRAEVKRDGYVDLGKLSPNPPMEGVRTAEGGG